MGLWTLSHFYTLVPSVIAMVIITGVLYIFLLKDKSLNIRMLPFQILNVFLLLIEVIKQILSIIEGYQYHYLPFHFCSLFLVVLPTMAFYRGPYQDVLGCLSSSLCLSLFLFMSVYPNLLYGPDAISTFFTNYFNFHTVTFHSIPLFALILIIGLRLHKPTKKWHFIPILIVMVCFCFIASVVAYTMEVNFSSFYYCHIPPIEEARLKLVEKIGFFGKLIYTFTAWILHITVVLISYVLYVCIQYAYGKYVVKDYEIEDKRIGELGVSLT